MIQKCDFLSQKEVQYILLKQGNVPVNSLEHFNHRSETPRNDHIFLYFGNKNELTKKFISNLYHCKLWKIKFILKWKINISCSIITKIMILICSLYDTLSDFLFLFYISENYFSCFNRFLLSIEYFFLELYLLQTMRYDFWFSIFNEILSIFDKNVP